MSTEGIENFPILKTARFLKDKNSCDLISAFDCLFTHLKSKNELKNTTQDFRVLYNTLKERFDSTANIWEPDIYRKAIPTMIETIKKSNFKDPEKDSEVKYWTYWLNKRKYNPRYPK